MHPRSTWANPTLTPAFIQERRDIGAATKDVYSAMGRIAVMRDERDPKVTVRHEDVAKVVGMSRRSIGRHIRRLVEVGLLEERDWRGREKSYWFVAPEVQDQ